MSKKDALSKTYVSSDGKIAKTYYPDGKIVVQFSRHGSFTGPRDPNEQKRAQQAQELLARNAARPSEPRKPSFREQLRKDLGLDQFRPKR